MTVHFASVSAHADTVPAEARDASTGENPYKVHGVYNKIIKRAIDLLLVICAVPLVLPIVLLMAVMVAMDGHNPFYSQQRVGRGGREFRIWKMRTMVPNAEAALKRYLEGNAEARTEWHETQKLRDDPRITRIGAFLRKSSLDELPQLFNVFNGTMSLVGPRPMMTCQKKLYPGKAYYMLRPGITGPWQVSERNETNFAGRAPFDDHYARNVSLPTDIRLLLQTVGVVFRATGI